MKFDFNFEVSSSVQSMNISLSYEISRIEKSSWMLPRKTENGHDYVYDIYIKNLNDSSDSLCVSEYLCEETTKFHHDDNCYTNIDYNLSTSIISFFDLKGLSCIKLQGKSLSQIIFESLIDDIKLNAEKFINSIL